MKLTNQRLKRIIKEEIAKALKERQLQRVEFPVAGKQSKRPSWPACAKENARRQGPAGKCICWQPVGGGYLICHGDSSVISSDLAPGEKTEAICPKEYPVTDGKKDEHGRIKCFPKYYSKKKPGY